MVHSIGSQDYKRNGKDVEETVAYFKILSQNLPAGAKEIHKNNFQCG
jgi:hypothetical protein